MISQRAPCAQTVREDEATIAAQRLNHRVPMTWASDEGLPYPLGVSWSEADQAYNFALYSKHATTVRLLLFDERELATPTLDRSLEALTNKSGRIWHCRLPADQVAGSRYYGYVVDGPDAAGPFEWHAFDRTKLLLDPYTRSVAFPPGFDRMAAIRAGSNLGKAPLGVLAPEPPFDWTGECRPHHDADAIIYELHVGHFTQHPGSGVSDVARGTFAGVVEKIPYLRELGVTVVELMPVFQFDPQGRDVWGYMPLSFFAPHRGYAHGRESPLDAFRTMIKALHDADIEVVLDVVYNHTAEGGADGPTYNFKGLDNSTYYLMRDGTYANYSGCGNSLNANNRYVRKMIMDSMRYWLRDMHVDGFRFDLASVFARSTDGTLDLDEPAIFGDISSDPLFDGARMIAEPWDATGASALGRAFPGISWLQWNSRFRDDVRRFVRGDADTTGALLQRVYGSDDLFPDDRLHAYHAYQSVNYVTSHDGHTLSDLVAGDVRQAKNFVALLMLSNGTPMLRAGDEMLQTQHGNPNPYDVDDETTWIDWSTRDRYAGYWRFVQKMIAFRKQHPSLARSRFWRDDIRWFGPDGVVDYSRPTVAWCLRGASQKDSSLYVMVNNGDEPIRFVLQETTAPWRVVVDTSRESPDDIELERPPLLERPSYETAAHSVVVLVA